MLRGFPFFIAKRYIRSGGEPRFASFLTVISVAGVAIGAAALIVVMSVMNGFGRDLERKLLGFSPHITVSAAEGLPDGALIEKVRGVSAGITDACRFASGEVIIQTPGEGGFGATGAKVLGLDSVPANMRQGTKFHWTGWGYGDSWAGRFTPPLDRGAVIGEELSYQIGAYPDLGSRVQLIAPFGGIDPLGNPAPTRREYPVTGAFRSGFFEYDTKYVLIKYDEARRLLKSQGRYGLRLMVKDASDAEDIAKKLRAALGPSFEVSSWTGKNRRLFAALRLERFAMSSILFLIVVIASFSIVGVTLMIFFSKRRELAVMMAVGACRRMVERIFLLHGALIGLAGALIGTAAGMAVCHLISRSNIALPPSYYLDYLPVAVSAPLVLAAGVGAVLMSVAASYYPARRASDIDPIELLRYE